MNSPNAAKEAERALNGANGLQIHTNINGEPLDEPKFFPVFEAAARHGKPVFLHPRAARTTSPTTRASRNRYEIWWAFGWPYETSAAMARLVFSGILDKLPDLKCSLCISAPWCRSSRGASVPAWTSSASASDEDLTLVLKCLKKRPFDYFKDFYADTAVFGSRPATICGLEFYGPDRVLFASDCPFDPEKGPSTSATPSRCSNPSTCRRSTGRRSRSGTPRRCSASSRQGKALLILAVLSRPTAPSGAQVAQPDIDVGDDDADRHHRQGVGEISRS